LKRLAQVFDINPSWLLLEQGPKFLNNSNKHGPQENNPAGNREYQVPLETQDPDLEKLIYYFKNSPFVKYSLMGYFYQLLKRNKDIIDEDIDNKKSPGKR
jgi:hypothetical protein